MSKLDDVLNLVIDELNKNDKDCNSFININEIEKKNYGSLIYSLMNFINNEYRCSVKTFYPVNIDGDKIYFFGEISEYELKVICPQIKVTTIQTKIKEFAVTGIVSNLFSEVIVSEIWLDNENLINLSSLKDNLFSFLFNKIGLNSSDNFNNKNDFSLFLNKWAEYQQNYIISHRIIAA